MKTHLVFVALLAAGHANLAFADEEAPDVGDPLTMNSLTPVSTFGLEVGVPIWDPDDQNASLTTVGINLHGHYVHESGVGGYLTVPLSFVSYHVDIPVLEDIDDSEFSIGNVEIGGMYSKWLRHFAVVSHIGVALPTNSADNPSTGNLFPAGSFSPFATAPRYTDLVDRIHESTWLRLGSSLMGRQGKLFWRGDLGIDIGLDEDENSDKLSPTYYFNVGGGVDLGSVMIHVELDTLVTDTDGDDTNTVLAFGARFKSGKLRPGISMFLPLGWDNNIDWDFGFGVSILSHL